MQISYLKIGKWCILDQIELVFETQTPILIGENGSGKSSVIEAISLIFGHLHKYISEGDIDADFIEDYHIIYSIRGDDNEIHSVDLKCIGHNTSDSSFGIFNYVLRLDGDIETVESVNKRYRHIGGMAAFLPNSIIIYYSGITKRLEDLSLYFYNKYKAEILKNPNDYSLYPLKLPNDRLFIYSDAQHLPITLLALLVNGTQSEVVNKLSIPIITLNIIIRLKKPNWATENSKVFWGAKKGVIQDFLVGLVRYSVRNSFEEKSIEIYLSLFEIEDYLSSMKISDRGLFLFSILDYLIYNELLDSIDLSWKSGDDLIELDRLSEGEKQIILTSGLVELWQKKNSLFLFDEPDTFLHPSWQVMLVPEISNFLKANQAIITTHSTLLISSIKDGEILKIEKGKSILFGERTFGMDANSVLLEAMNVQVRAPEVQDKIDEIEILIQKRELEKAHYYLNELEKIVGGNNTIIIRLSSLIKRMEIIGR